MATLIYLSQNYSYHIRGDRSPLTFSFDLEKSSQPVRMRPVKSIVKDAGRSLNVDQFPAKLCRHWASIGPLFSDLVWCIHVMFFISHPSTHSVLSPTSAWHSDDLEVTLWWHVETRPYQVDPHPTLWLYLSGENALYVLVGTKWTREYLSSPSLHLILASLFILSFPFYTGQSV